jgi:hypothetical protein
MSNKLLAVNITLGAAARATQAQTLSRLEASGLQDATVLDVLGLVSGRISEDKLPALKQIAGVDVELDDTIDIGPPDAVGPR